VDGSPEGGVLKTLVVCAALLFPVAAGAQDLFELTVYPYETVAAGETAVELHSNFASKGVVPTRVGLAEHHPVHLSAEITHAWTKRFETGVFLQTAPFASRNSARFAGGHIRPQFRFRESRHLPFRVAVSGEYAFNRAAFDLDIQTVEIRTILDRKAGRLALILNPSLEMIIKGPEGELAPAFDLSARMGWALTPQVTVNGEYFSRPGTLRHLQPEATAHHLLFAGMGIELPDTWELKVGAGHCVSSGEPWLITSVVGFRFGA
jgi:hypothetical protein